MVKELFPNMKPREVAEYYGFPQQYTGKGQSVAVIEIGGVLNMGEVESDFKALGVPVPSIKQVVVDKPYFSRAQNESTTTETHLDIEVIGSICPDAAITIYRGPFPNGLGNTVAKAIEDKNSVISISLSLSETLEDQFGELEQVFKDAATKGVTICVAAGDGSSSATRKPATGQAIPVLDGLAHVNYPASSPYVLACGGTELVSDNGQKVEYVWNNAESGGGATGGGVSRLFDLPSWQTEAGIKIPSANPGCHIGRVIPDVAGLAAGGDWEIFQNHRGFPIGGTSAVAPLWASLIVLVNEARAAQGKASLGFLNEKLYKLAAQGGMFNDITVGNNRPTPTYPGYDAATGFDACSGWGTPIASKLFPALVELP